MKKFRSLREARRYLENYPYVDKPRFNIYHIPKSKDKVYHYAVCSAIEWLNR